MHGAFGHTGGARGEGQDTGVVRSGVHIGEHGAVAHHGGLQALFWCAAGCGVEVTDVVQHGALGVGSSGTQVVGQAHVTQRMGDFALSDHLLDFLGAQQGHGGHRNTTGLHHGKPAGHQHGVVGCTQQHTVAGHQTHVGDQHVGDAVGMCQQIGIGPAHTWRLDAHTVTPAFVDGPVEQLGGTVQLRRKLQFRQIEQVFGLLVRRRQPVIRKGIDMGACHGAELQKRGLQLRQL